MAVLLYNSLSIVNEKRKWLMPVGVVLLTVFSAYFSNERTPKMGMPFSFNVACSGVTFMYIGHLIRVLLDKAPKVIDNKIKISTVNKKLDEVIDFDIKLFERRKVIHLFSNIFDIKGISLKHISENLLANLTKDNYVLCVSPYYQHVENRYNTLLQYFQRPLVWQFRDSQSQKRFRIYL